MAKGLRGLLVVLPPSKHTRVLVAAGLSYVGIGFTYVVAEPSRSREQALAIALQLFPIQLWGWIFASIGIVTIISSRWPPVTKRWGYALVTGAAAGWAATYALGVVIRDSPPQNLSGALLWANFAYLWYVVSGLPELDAKTYPEEAADGFD